MRLAPMLVVTTAIALAHAAPTFNPGECPVPSRAPAGASQAGVAVAAVAPDAPFEITELRERCDELRSVPAAVFRHHPSPHRALVRRQSPLRGLFSGNDAAQGIPLCQGECSDCSFPIPWDCQGPDPLRNPHDRSADRLGGAVTDHSEHFGEMGICKNLLGLDAPAVLSMECRMLNGFYYQPETLSPSNALDRGLASDAFAQLTMMNVGPARATRACRSAKTIWASAPKRELAVWQEEQNAAEEEYDRQRRLHLHDLRRLREHLDAAGHQLASQRPLPQ